MLCAEGQRKGDGRFLSGNNASKMPGGQPLKALKGKICQS